MTAFNQEKQSWLKKKIQNLPYLNMLNDVIYKLIPSKIQRSFVSSL